MTTQVLVRPAGYRVAGLPVALAKRQPSYDDDLVRVIAVLQRDAARRSIIDRANNGEFKKRFDYHGDTRHAFTDERVIEILKNPDAVYHSTGTAGTFTFRQGDDIVVIDGPGNTQGQAITAYGPSGIKGHSGANALGGKPTDPGAPVTDEAIVKGTIPAKDGGFQPPAVRIR